MGLLGNILSGAVSDAIGKVVGEAAKKVVTPAAEHLAEKQAEVIDNLAKKAETAMNEAEAAAKTAEASEAEKAPLTEEEKAKQAQAIEALKGLSGMFSGAMAMAKKEMEAEEAARKAAEEAIFEHWEEHFPYYPKWDVGGEQFELEELEPMNGYPSWRLGLKGRPYLVELYAQKLRADGFKAKGNDPFDLNADTYYKLVDGVCYAWNRTDACQDGFINVGFYVDKYVEPKPKQQTAAQSANELAKVAKGLFKKLF